MYDRDRDTLASQALVAAFSRSGSGDGAASPATALEPYHVEPAAQPLHLVELARALSREARAGLPTVIVVVATGRVDHVASLVRAQSGLPVVLLLAESSPAARGSSEGSLSAQAQASVIDASAAGVLVSASTAGCVGAVQAIVRACSASGAAKTR